jgi:hypothetical protein
MAYLHEAEAYEKDPVFSQDDLAALTPIDIKRWMCVKADKNVIFRAGF